MNKVLEKCWLDSFKCEGESESETNTCDQAQKQDVSPCGCRQKGCCLSFLPKQAHAFAIKSVCLLVTLALSCHTACKTVEGWFAFLKTARFNVGMR